MAIGIVMQESYLSLALGGDSLPWFLLHRGGVEDALNGAIQKGVGG